MCTKFFDRICFAAKSDKISKETRLKSIESKIAQEAASKTQNTSKITLVPTCLILKHV